MLKRTLQGLGIGVLAALLALALWRCGALDRWEYHTWDWRAGLLARPVPTTDSIRLIFLDQASLDWGSERMHLSWPWPRQVYAPVLDFCRRGGARVVAFDVIFSEPSATGVEDDLMLGDAIRTGPPFVGTVFVGRKTGSRTAWPEGVPHPAIRLAGVPLPALALHRASFPIPEVATNATLLASVFGNPDPGGIYRRVRPLSLFAGQPVPALGLGACLAGDANRVIQFTPDGLQAGGRNIPLDRDGNAILRFRGPSQTHRTVNINAVIESELRLREDKPPLIDPSFFKGKYVFLGYTAPGLFDLKPSPVGEVYPGVEIHATFLDNLLAGDLMRDAPPAATVALTLLLAALAALAVRLGRAAWQNVVVICVCLPLPVALGIAAYTRGYWLPVVAPLAAAAPAMVAALAVNYATEGRQKRFIKGAFKQYLSPAVIDELVQHPERLRLGGELRELTMLFSDIQGFTGISERLAPEPLTTLLNEYLTAMTEVIYAEGGTVDKYEGDAIIAFWNAPLAYPDHAVRAVRAALRCQARLAELSTQLAERAGAELVTRIGVNSGHVVIGNMGSLQRFNYTFLGDAGNLASRLEGINKQFGTRILISEMTRAPIGEAIPVREISRVQVVGRKEPVRVYEPLGDASDAARQTVYAAYAQGLAAYYAGRFEEALAAFAGIEAQDPPAAAHARRCRALLASPPAQWSGVWTMTEK